MQCLIDQLVEDVKHVRPAVEKTRPNVTKNPDVDRLEEDVNRMSKRWGNCCMQVVERLRSCEAACELLEKYNMSYQTETNWMDELVSTISTGWPNWILHGEIADLFSIRSDKSY